MFCSFWLTYFKMWSHLPFGEFLHAKSSRFNRNPDKNFSHTDFILGSGWSSKVSAWFKSEL